MIFLAFAVTTGMIWLAAPRTPQSNYWALAFGMVAAAAIIERILVRIERSSRAKAAIAAAPPGETAAVAGTGSSYHNGG